jgi:hypothetical protein
MNNEWVWIVTHDRTGSGARTPEEIIVGVFSTEEKAQDFAKKYGVYRLDNYPVDAIPRWLKPLQNSQPVT